MSISSRLQRKGKELSAGSPGGGSSLGVRAPDFEYNDGTPSKKSRLNTFGFGQGGMLGSHLASSADQTQMTQSSATDPSALNSTSYNDPIHQLIVLDDLTTRLIDTPQFQRLQALKQLGTCDYVYRGATHTRFEHSIGVAHLAEKVITKIRAAQPHLDVTDLDVTCVKVAGLIHDLGHGPFSHVFDGVFIARMHPDGIDGKGSKWKHEDGSVSMFELMLKKNDINLGQWGLTEQDETFIKEIVAGTKEEKRQGRGRGKFWMYDIVNNSRSGLDVDKLDYFMRDMRYANVQMGINDFTRFIELGRVLPAQPLGRSVMGLNKEDLPTMICYPLKMYEETLGLFQVRFKMHRTVYTHKTVKQIEYMITDALQLADEFVTIRGTKSPQFPDGAYKMSETIYDMEAFSKLKDTILDHIMLLPADEDDTSQSKLLRAQELITRVRQRDLYRCVGKVHYRKEAKVFKMKERTILEAILEVSREGGSSSSSSSSSSNSSGCGGGGGEDNGILDMVEGAMPMSPCQFSNVSQGSVGSPAPFMHAHPGHFGSQLDLAEEDLIVEKMHIHHGMKGANPVSKVRFFHKHSGEDAVGLQVDEKYHETALPKAFEDFAIRVFCRNPAKEDRAREAFTLWRKKHLC